MPKAVKRSDWGRQIFQTELFFAELTTTPKRVHNVVFSVSHRDRWEHRELRFLDRILERRILPKPLRYAVLFQCYIHWSRYHHKDDSERAHGWSDSPSQRIRSKIMPSVLSVCSSDQRERVREQIILIPAKHSLDHQHSWRFKRLINFFPQE